MESEVDEFADYNRTASNTTALEYRPSFWFFSRQLLKIVLSLVAIICDILIVYAAFKLRKLQEVKYFHLLNWSVMDILRCLISPYVSFLTNAIVHEVVSFEGVICWAIQMESAAIFVICITVLLLNIDWIIGNIFQSWYDSYKSKLIFIKITFYAFTILYIWYTSLYCFSVWRQIQHSSVLNTLKFLVVFIVLLHIFHYVYSRRRNLLLKIDFTLILPTTFVLCWLPYLIVHTITHDDSISNNLLVACLFFFAYCFALSNAIFNVCLLAKTESEFKERLLEVIKGRYTNQFQSNYSDVYSTNTS